MIYSKSSVSVNHTNNYNSIKDIDLFSYVLPEELDANSTLVCFVIIFQISFNYPSDNVADCSEHCAFP